MRRIVMPFVIVVALTSACATNPATGKRDFNIVSESQEIAIGQQQHPEVIKQFGVYNEKPELTRLVEQVGMRLAAGSPRPNLPWHFTILDTPMVNAMALPGGYIYITRGMLERINSEDELAGVLGHEIAHVTARHAAQQMSRAELAQFGMVLGAVVAGPAAAQSYGQLAELGLGLLFQRYSRAQESQADQFGTDYIAKANYNPAAMESMLMTLVRLDKNPATGVDKYFESHPDPGKRVKDVTREVQKLAQAGPISTATPNRTAYVRQLEGVMTANSTERTIIKGGTIYDREHGMIIHAPAGWAPTTAPGMLFAMQPLNSRSNQQSAFVAQEIDTRELQGTDARDAIRQKLQQMGLQYLGSRNTVRTASGETFPIDVWSGQTQSGTVGVESTQFLHGDHVAVFLFLTPSLQRNVSPLGEILDRVVVDPATTRRVEPARIHIATVRGGQSWADLARIATGNAGDAEEIANLNGFDLNSTPPVGITVKLPQEVVKEQ